MGGLLGLGDLRVAALLGGEDRILLFRSRETYLAVALTQDAAPEDTESRIRQTIAARKARR